MNLEKRLAAAAKELNQASGNSAPPPFAPRTLWNNGWLAFSAAFAVVIAVIGIPLLIASLGPGSSGSGPLGSETTTTVCVRADATTAVVDGQSAAFAEQSDIDIIAFLNDEGSEGVAEGGHLELLAAVESWDEVVSATYFDKEKTWAEYQRIFEGQDDLLDIDPAILPASIRVELVDVEFQSVVQARLEQRMPVVRDVAVAPPTPVESGFVDEEGVVDCVEEATSTTTVIVDCVTSELYPPTTVGYSDDGTDPRDTTEPVRDKLSRIAEAAQICDQAGLAALAGENFTTSFGAGDGSEELQRLHEEGVEVYRILGDLANMSHGVVEMENGERLFVWPAAFAYDNWDDIPQENLNELSLLYSQEELDQLSLLGVYGGWRIGITESGEWLFFVAGD